MASATPSNAGTSDIEMTVIAPTIDQAKVIQLISIFFRNINSQLKIYVLLQLNILIISSIGKEKNLVQLKKWVVLNI